MSNNPNNEFQFADKNIIDKYGEDFMIIKNDIIMKKYIENREQIIDELEEKGIMSAFMARKNGFIFRENGLTSEEASINAKEAEEAYINIQNAALYDISNPEQAAAWINTLVPYLNNIDLDIESYTKMGVPSAKTPIDEILEKIEETGNDKLISAPATAEEVAHNRIVNSYNRIKFEIRENPDSLNISKELDNLSSIVNNNDLIEKAKSIQNYSELKQNIDKYRNIIFTEGANKAILNILESKGYNIPEEVIVQNDDVKNLGMTDEQYEHNVIFNMYQEIKDCGFVISDFYKQMVQEENQVQAILSSDEMKIYLEKMEERTNKTTFTESKDDSMDLDDIMEITKTRKIALPAFIEKIINKHKKGTPEQENLLNDEEKQIKQKLEDLKNYSYDTFAYGLRDLKKYINNPEKPLNLTDGTNVIETIITKAEELGIATKSVKDIKKENPNVSETLLYYSKNQLEDLKVYGCFLTSKCNDIIRQNLKEENKENSVKENNQIPPIVNDLDKQLPAIKIDINDIIKRVIEPGIMQTEEEKNIIQGMMDINTKSSPEKIEEINKKVKQLKPSTTQQIISKSWNDFISQKNNKKPNINQFNSIIDNLVSQNNAIIEKTGLEKGIRISDIHDELESLRQELTTLESNKSTLDNGLTIMETITKSDKKDNTNYEEFYQNITSQKQSEIDKLVKETEALISETKKSEPVIVKDFMNNFRQHAEARKELKTKEPFDKQLLNEEIKCAQEYLKVKEYIIKLETIGRVKVSSQKQQIDNNEEREKIAAEMKAFINSIVIDDVHTEQDTKNLLAVAELMDNKNKIAINQAQIQDKKLELSQIQANTPNNLNQTDIIKNKIKKLELEEEMLSFNPQIVKEELTNMIKSGKSKEEISVKLDSLIMPIKEYNSKEAERLNKKIEVLENKISNNSNYLDEEKIVLETEKKDNIQKMIAEKDSKLVELQSMLQSNKELDLLTNQRGIIEKQLKGYEEEKQILLQWNIEESESDLGTRKALDELFEESRNNLSSIKSELDQCNSKIEKIESKSNLSVEEINNIISELNQEKEQLTATYENISKSLEEKTDLKYINKEAKLSDIEKLQKYKQELEKLKPENLDKQKEKFLKTYNKELEHPTDEILPLPGQLANGDEIKSDGNIVKKSPELPGQLSNGDKLNSDGTIEKNNDLDQEEILDITEPSDNLLKKALNSFKKCGKKILDWIKKHPKITAAIGATALAVTVGTTILIKSLSGETLDDATPDIPIIPDDNIEQEADIDTTNKTEVETIADEAIQETSSFDDSYNSAINDILEGKSNVYISADRAINNQEAVSNIFNPSFETSKINKLYSMDDGNLHTVSYDEAKQIVENGGTVSAQITNDGIGIGYVAIDGDNANSQDIGGMSK